MTIQRKPFNVVRNAARSRSSKSKPQGFSLEVRDIIATRSRGVCEIGRCESAAEHMHHRRPRGLGGTSVPWVNKAANALHLCMVHHAYVESHRTLAIAEGWLISQHRTDAVATDIPVTRNGKSVLLSDDGSFRPVGGEA